MSGFNEWLEQERQGAAAQPPSSFDEWSGFVHESRTQPPTGNGGFLEWLERETETPGFMAPLSTEQIAYGASYGTSSATGTGGFHRWLEDEELRQPPRRARQDTLVLPRGWYESQGLRSRRGDPYGNVTPPVARYPYPLPPYPRPRERERPRVLRTAVALGAAALSLALLATSLAGSRGHVDANPSQQPSSPTPTATSTGHPKWWRPILRGKTINMANAAYDAEHGAPGAVRRAKDSTEEIIDYSNPDGSGHVHEMQGTAYVAEGPDGKPRVFTAAHCVYGGLDGSAPNYLLQTNVNGELHQDFFIDVQVPDSYNPETDTEIGSSSDDIAEGDIMARYWYDVHGVMQTNENGISGIPPLKIALGKAAVGTLIYTWGMRPVKGEELTPPQSPVLQAMVVAGYADNGNRMILVPVEPRDPQQEQGNSGSALLDVSGKVDATLIAGGVMPSGEIKDLTGLTVAGGDGTQIDLNAVPIEIGEVDNVHNLGQVASAQLFEPNIPKVTPRVIYYAGQ